MHRSRAVVVGIVCGSVSDFGTVDETMKTLDELGVTYSLDVKSAHRLPDDMREYAIEAEKRGYKVIIAAAGGAVDLSGMIAAYTLLPVIGLPVKTASLSGLDSLFSMVQMPEGVPVGVMGIERGKNAAIFAAEILGLGDPELRRKLQRYRAKLAERTRAEAAKTIALVRRSKKNLA
jgi:phosphoribosylaminoimidazole carboxylase PurE protein